MEGLVTVWEKQIETARKGPCSHALPESLLQTVSLVEPALARCQTAWEAWRKGNPRFLPWPIMGRKGVAEPVPVENS
jgi:hypothetical protein